MGRSGVSRGSRPILTETLARSRSPAPGGWLPAAPPPASGPLWAVPREESVLEPQPEPQPQPEAEPEPEPRPESRPEPERESDPQRWQEFPGHVQEAERESWRLA